MAVKPADSEEELIDAICARVRERLPSEQAPPCESFVRQYYHWVPAEDLIERDPIDLYGAAVAHWKLSQHRDPGEMKIRVYNPDSEHDGWSSSHTVVELVTDDMPFIVDTVTMELNRQGYGIDIVLHPVIRVRRDRDGNLIELLEPEAEAQDAVSESIIHAEVIRTVDEDELTELREGVLRVLGDVELAVRDWEAMRKQMTDVAQELERNPPPIEEAEIQEVKEFLDWVANHHFTFLGYREYAFEETEDSIGLQAVEETGLGILSGPPATPLTVLKPKALALAKTPHLLVLTKANSRATVHRPAYLDYIGVKMINDAGEVVGERRFLGLYTSSAYKQSPLAIPLLRNRVKTVLDRAGFGAREPRLQGAAGDPRVLPARLAVPDRGRRAVRGGDRDPRAGRAPAAAAVRPSGPARPLHGVPRMRPPRPVQHREPRADRPSARRWLRRHAGRLVAVPVGIAARARPLHRPPGAQSPRDIRPSRDRGTARTGDASLGGRPACGVDRGARRGPRDAAVCALPQRVPARLP